MNKELGLIALVSLLIAAGYLSTYTGAQDEFASWKAKYGMSWANEEEAYRRLVFEQNMLAIRKHNADSTQTYKMGVNQFSVYTDEEFATKFLTPMPLLGAYHAEQEYELLGDVDWTTKGAVSPIKNQGNCGSCWAFSTTGVLESWALLKGQRVSLSEQQLVDCSTSFGNHGCQGGWPASALNYVKANGIAGEGEYPYKAVNQACAKNGGSFKLSAYKSSANCAALASDINSQPISVTVDATNWSKYSSGVFNNCAASINHAVLLVGVIGGNWKIKNSWGTGWGEQGFIRLSTGNTCGVCAYPSPFPTA